jgi:hypothetical protein
MARIAFQTLWVEFNHNNKTCTNRFAGAAPADKERGVDICSASSIKAEISSKPLYLPPIVTQAKKEGKKSPILTLKTR